MNHAIEGANNRGLKLVGDAPAAAGEHGAEHMITLPIVEWFAAYLLDERHFSQYTARCYSADLRQYVEHLSGALKIIPNTDSEKAAVDARAAGSPATPGTITASVCAANPDSIRGFLAHLGTLNYSAATMGAQDRHAPVLLQVGRAAQPRGREPHDRHPHAASDEAAAQGHHHRADRAPAGHAE